MKAIYNEFFHVPEEGRIREKVMLVRIAVSVALMAFCLVAMSISAYAYFSCNVSSSMNTIQSAYYDLEITYQNGSEEIVLDSNTFTCDVADKDTYTFTLTPSGTADNGYCKIVVSNGTSQETYYTTQIFKTDEEKNDRLNSLTLNIQATGCTITFIPQWGTSSYFVNNEITLYGNNDCIQHATTSVEEENTETIQQSNTSEVMSVDVTEQTTETDTTTQQEETTTPETTTKPTTESTTESTTETTTETITETTTEPATETTTEPTTDPTTETTTEPAIDSVETTTPTETTNTETHEGES